MRNKFVFLIIVVSFISLVPKTETNAYSLTDRIYENEIFYDSFDTYGEAGSIISSPWQRKVHGYVSHTCVNSADDDLPDAEKHGLVAKMSKTEGSVDNFLRMNVDDAVGEKYSGEELTFLKVSADVLMPSGSAFSSTKPFEIRFRDKSKNNENIISAGNYIFTMSDGTTVPYEEGKWYSLVFYVDFTEKVYSLYIDGNLAALNLEINSLVSPPVSLDFSGPVRNSAYEFYIDNVRFALESDWNELFFDDFESYGISGSDIGLSYWQHKSHKYVNNRVSSASSLELPDAEKHGMVACIRKDEGSVDNYFRMVRDGGAIAGTYSDSELKYTAVKFDILTKTGASFSDTKPAVLLAYDENKNGLEILKLQKDFMISSDGEGILYEEGVWYTLAFYFDFEKNTYSVCVGGTLVAKDISTDNLRNVTSIGFSGPVRNTAYEFYMDNVRFLSFNPRLEFDGLSIFNEDFEDYTKGYSLENTLWFNSASNFFVSDFSDEQKDYEGEGFVAKFLTNASENSKINVRCCDYDKTRHRQIAVEFDILSDKSSDISISLGDSEFLKFLEIKKDGTVKSDFFTQKFEAGKWHTVSAGFDFGQKTYTVFVDGVLIKNECLYYQNICGAENLNFDIFSDCGNVIYLDNMKITSKTPEKIPDVPEINLKVKDGQVHAECDIDNDFSGDAVMLLGIYDNNEKLEYFFTDDGKEEGGKTSFCEETPILQGERASAFLFDNMTDISPLTEKESVCLYLPSDFDDLKEKWKKYLVGDKTNDTGDPYQLYRINEIYNSGKSAWEIMKENKNSENGGLWGSITQTYQMTSAYNKIYQMALAWGTFGSELYGNDELKQDIIYSLEYMYQNYYGQAEIEGTGWRDTSLYNWWDWKVGSPKAICDTLIILGDNITDKQAEKYLSFYLHLLDISSDKLEERGEVSTRAYNQMAAGTVLENSDLVNEIHSHYHILFSYVDSGTGMYKDHSYINHNMIAYNGHYGTTSLLDRVISICSIISGTRFDFTKSVKSNYENWLYYAYEPLMFNGGMMSMVRGRMLYTEGEYAEGIKVFESILDMSDSLSDEGYLHAKMLIKRHLIPEISDYVYKNLSVTHIKKLEEILNDPDLSEPEDYLISKVYYNMDRVVHQRGNWVAGVSMSSERIANYESINYANEKGWYTGDGMLYIYNYNDVFQFDSDYFNCSDPYKRAGTTVDTQNREDKSGREYFSNQDFVGGVSLDNLFSAAAMQLESYHSDGEDAHNCTLTAKKTWFMFDDEVVALGCDISAQDGFDVLTVAENRKLKNGDEVLTGKDGEITANGLLPENPEWIHLENFGGYYFPDGGNLNVQRETNDKTFIKMWFDHGVNPQNSTYEYVVLPNMSSTETLKYAQNPDITVLSNTPFLQAVSENSLGICGMVFWEKGSFGDITVTRPLIVMVREDDEEYVISLSDPTHKLKKARIIINKTLKNTYADDGLLALNENGFTVIEANLDGSDGKSFTAGFKK